MKVQQASHFRLLKAPLVKPAAVDKPAKLQKAVALCVFFLDNLCLRIGFEEKLKTAHLYLEINTSIFLQILIGNSIHAVCRLVSTDSTGFLTEWTWSRLSNPQLNGLSLSGEG